MRTRPLFIQIPYCTTTVPLAVTGLALLLLSLTGCTDLSPKPDHSAQQHIDAALQQAAQSPATTTPDAINAALLPPLQLDLPAIKAPAEPKFDLVINNAPAAQVFLGIVSGTRYSMLVPPDLTGNVSLSLKNVSLLEALDAIRELYGYDYHIEGTRIFIEPMTMQTRVFKVDYIAGQRKGSSDIRVTSGSVSDTPPSPNGVPNAIPTSNTTDSNNRSVETSKISTHIETNFWNDLSDALNLIIGDKDGRRVVVNQQSGVILVHALPVEIHEVISYLKAIQLSIDRQVMLEAKIIQVDLGNQYQTGINWAAFNAAGQNRFSVGADPASISAPGNLPLTNTLSSLFSPGIPAAITTTAGVLNVTAQSTNFAALLNFLSTQGNTHVLSSPRIATLNNQMAVLKVGTDDFFVTNVTSTVTGISTTTTTATPNVTLRPFFSGVALDVMPEISAEGQITLHIHPTVSKVVEKNSVINLGQSLGILTLPLASSTISETDSIVRVQDGTIVAIGGLMSETTNDDQSQIPGLGGVPLLGSMFSHTNRVTQKSELVILLKTTVIQGGDDWTQDVLQNHQQMQITQHAAQ